jgi:hypothetical protein
MKSNILFFSFLLFLSASCGNNDKKSDGQSSNNIDAARNFIRAALDGKFNEAKNFLLKDSVNLNWMDIAERSYKKADQNTKDGYLASSINMHQVNPVNDSVTIIIYSNSFKNDHDTLKVVKIKGEWLVDLKYLFEHDTDTLLQKQVNIDTLK